MNGPRRSATRRRRRGPLLASLVAHLVALAVLVATHSVADPLLQVPDALALYQGVDGATGGQVFTQQPKVRVVNSDGDHIDTTATLFEGGEILVHILVSPMPDVDINQVNVLDTTPKSAIIVAGWANFSDLWINEQGVGYVLEFYSYDLGATEPGRITSNEFNVTEGSAVEIAIRNVNIWNGFGGQAFAPQPEVVLLDSGGNTVTANSDNIVTVAICTEAIHGCTDPGTGGQLLTLGTTSFTSVQLVEGVAIFTGLAIDVAGMYKLVFTIDMVITTTFVVSMQFPVSIGAVTTINMGQPISGARGGMVWDVLPTISLEDSGGNLFDRHSFNLPSSTVLLELMNNPEGAVLSSAEFPTLVRGFENGFANFTDLVVDKIGQDYYLKVSVEVRTTTELPYTMVGFSDPFDVLLGESSSIEIVRGIGGAWAGGQPFLVQPVLQLRDAGGNVMETDSSTQVTASIIEWPDDSSTLLGGTTLEVADLGIIRFNDLSMVQRGVAYMVEYRAENNFTANETFTVVPSTEFEMMAEDVQPNDQNGFAVALFENTLVSGAPGEDSPVKEMQRVSIEGSAETTVNEVQRVTSSGFQRQEIQTMKMCGYGGGLAAIRGYFTISWNGLGPTRPLRYDVSSIALASYLQEDIPEIGKMSVIQVKHFDCDAVDTYIWTLVFQTRQGIIPLVELNIVGEVTPTSPSNSTFRHNGVGDEFTGVVGASTAVNITANVTRMQESTPLSGFFRLHVGADGTTKGSGETNATVLLPYDADAAVVQAAIEEAMPIDPADNDGQEFELVDVSRAGPDGQHGYIWEITFPNSGLFFDYVEIEPEYEGLLEGLSPTVSTRTITQGAAPIRGTFTLYFKGIGPSPPINYNETEAGMVTKLEAIDTIDQVSVTRFGPTDQGGYTWAITFEATRTVYEYGFSSDVEGNIAPIQADTTGLVGTNSKVIVQYAFGADDMDTMECKTVYGASVPFCEFIEADEFLLEEFRPVMGKFGHETGAAYVFVRQGEQWAQTAKLHSSDGDSYDNFGYSVSIDNTTSARDTRAAVIAVGAPYAEVRGQHEVQTVTCTADSGTFRLSFRTRWSSPINTTVTESQFKYELESMATLYYVEVEYSLPGGPLCTTDGSNVASVVFRNPSDGDIPELVPDPNDDGGSTVLFNGAPTPGTVVVVEETRGSLKVGNSGYVVGAAYVFEPVNANQPDTWIETEKLLASDGMAGDTFGHSIAVFLDTIVVGAPEHDDGGAAAGALYVFRKDVDTGEWLQTQKLVVPTRQGYEFTGHVVKMQGNTIVTGAPGYRNNAGCVYIFKRISLEHNYVYDQQLAPGDGVAGDRFGSSLSFDLHTLLVGAEDAAVTRPDLPEGDTAAPLPHAGAVYTYTRPGFRNLFTLEPEQKVVSLNPLPYARFGHGVGVKDNIAVITELQEYRGAQYPRKEVQSIRTHAIPGTNPDGTPSGLGNLFAVTWRRKAVGSEEYSIRRAERSADRYNGLGLRADVREGVYEAVQTQWLENNITATDLRKRLMDDLGTGLIQVDRDGPDSLDGYTWIITFLDIEGEVPKFGTISRLTGTEPQITVEVLKSASSEVYGMGHVLKRSSGIWKQHAVIRPESHQDADLFGISCVLHSQFAVVGASNRDSLVTGNNGGAAYIFDVGFMNLRFQDPAAVVPEDVAGGRVTITVLRCDPICDVGDNLRVDRTEFVTLDATAKSRTDCLTSSNGTDQCLWQPADDHRWDPTVDTTESASASASGSTIAKNFSHFDFGAVSDFAPDNDHLTFDVGQAETTFDVVITNDNVYEYPDEYLYLLLQAPGMRPVKGGDLWASLTITDDGDGGEGSRDYFTKLNSPNLEVSGRYGSCVSLDDDLAVVGVPGETVNGLKSAGAIYVYVQLSGIWQLEQRIESLSPRENARFGVSVDLHNRNSPRMIIGEPGQDPPAAYVFVRRVSVSTSTGYLWSLDATFGIGGTAFDDRCAPATSNGRCNNEHNPVDHMAYFGGERSVAISYRWAVVGAKGLEAIFVFVLTGEDATATWSRFQTVRSPDYYDAMYPLTGEHRKVYPLRPLFGAAVDISEDTIVVGAQLEEYDRFEGESPDASKALTCAAAAFSARGGAGTMADLVREWTLNSYSNGYTWAGVATSAGTITDDTAASATPEVACSELDANTLIVTTAALPDHAFGLFPLTSDTMRVGVLDNGREMGFNHTLELHIPRNRNITNLNPVSVLHDRSQLPIGIIGVALNGVPFFNSFDANGDDTVDPLAYGYRGQVVDMCQGSPNDAPEQYRVPRLRGVYGYRSDPVCLYADNTYVDAVYGVDAVPQSVTGSLYALKFDTSVTVNPVGGLGVRSPLLGYALDGFPIYGPYDETGQLPQDLDPCNGRMDSVLGSYVYHITPYRKPYLIGCFRGSYRTSVPRGSSAFPNTMPDRTLNPESIDLRFYGKGAVYVFQRRAVEDGVDHLPTIGGWPMTPVGLNDSTPEAYTGEAFFFHTKLTAPDSAPGDRFGHSVALDVDQLLVGAYKDRAHARTTWDFETGDLRGWIKTGTAFNSQPTYGDNTAHRNVYGKVKIATWKKHHDKILTYRKPDNTVHEQRIVGAEVEVTYGETTTHVDHPVPSYTYASEIRAPIRGFFPGKSEPSALRGRWFIGTFESRPGQQYNNGTVVSAYPAGEVQGDEPHGTLTSDPFQIEGTKLSFLVGGGCDIRTVYVELLVDGAAVRKATGKCTETMSRVVWEVSTYKFQSGRIRIVDAASGTWGHINVDDFRFNWHESYRQRSTTPSADGSDRRSPAGGAVGYAGEPMAGAVYAFRRRKGGDGETEGCDLACPLLVCAYLHPTPQRWDCDWEFQEKLQPSDRRAGDHFGFALDVDHEHGTAVVAAYQARAVDALNGQVLGGRSQSGALYIFKRTPTQRSVTGELLEVAKWPITESFKLQVPDKVERDMLGFDVSISGDHVMAGAPSKSSPNTIAREMSFAPQLIEDGAAYIISAAFMHIAFEAKEFVVLENDLRSVGGQSQAIARVMRTGGLDTTLHVQYHTSDITAIGLSAEHAAHCMTLRFQDRGLFGCGDYVQTSGMLRFDPGVQSREFYVFTMNDECFESYPEYVGLHLSVPGGDVLVGEQYHAVLRIDDDDQGMSACSETRALSSRYPFFPVDEEKTTVGTPTQEEPVKLTETQRWILDNL